MGKVKPKGKKHGKYFSLLCVVLLLLILAVVCYILPFIFGGYMLFIPIVCAPGFAFLFIFKWGRLIQAREILLHPWYVPVVLLFWYLVMGFLFALGYKAAVEYGNKIVGPEGEIQSIRSLFYYSIVTASTLGYGDFKPLDSLVRLIACTEVISFWFILSLAVRAILESVKIKWVSTSVSGSPSYKTGAQNLTDSW